MFNVKVKYSADNLTSSFEIVLTILTERAKMTVTEEACRLKNTARLGLSRADYPNINHPLNKGLDCPFFGSCPLYWITKFIFENVCEAYSESV